MVFSVPARQSVSQLFKDKLHWLPIGARIGFKILPLIQKCLLYKFPQYLCAHPIPFKLPFSFKVNLKTFLYLEAFQKKLDSLLFNETSQAQKNLFTKKKKKPRTSK